MSSPASSSSPAPATNAVNDTPPTTMPLDGSKITPIVTGGGSGIGLGLVKEFLKYGSPKVIITGRREHVLKEAADAHPGKIFYKVSDAGSASDREELLAWVKENHPDCNALVNNAGIQRLYAPVEDQGSWEERSKEIEINFSGVVHLTTMFIPYFLEKKDETCMLANVSSGLAFVPYTYAPVYSATKAAVHSYTMAMRYSLQSTNVRMVEIVPPAVKTNLGGSHDFGEDLEEYCSETMKLVMAGHPEVGFRFSEKARLGDRATTDGMMDFVSSTMKTPTY
eukprot:CAMPEP_0119553952 /NCGR_PEP_ID=MMETSP1352-20130426/6556_1 /TAXON_ID=265584 /ORGANISM="Stauroneis constricta, Strain CCMP1120" /LENGTH=279 /DNA_ID=CAMNT_0007600445 /DNA_START=129 /DNA_END=968 /DNA_ORIENTATION=+